MHRLLEVTHAVHHYARGRQVLAKLAHESYDLLIIDRELSDLSDLDV